MADRRPAIAAESEEAWFLGKEGNKSEEKNP
jgi:hypothetical protein